MTLHRVHYKRRDRKESRRNKQSFPDSTDLSSSSTLSSMSRSSSVASNPKARAAAALFTGYRGGDSFPLGVAAKQSRPFCDSATKLTGDGRTAEGGGGPGGGEVS